MTGMLTISEITQGVKGLLEERFPKENVYLELPQEAPVRPYFLVEPSLMQMADANCGGVEVTARVVVTAFADGAAELQRRLMAVLELFAVGYLKAGDRALGVEKNTGFAFSDHAKIKLKLTYRDDRPGAQEWPLMGDILTQFKEEK